MKGFNWLNNRKLQFQHGAYRQLPHLAQDGRILLVRGGRWLEESGLLGEIDALFHRRGIQVQQTKVTAEPCPDIIDQAVAQYKEYDPTMVVAIGGGSVLDAAKAIAAMLCHPGSVTRYLEGVGDLPPSGATLPLIALPSTSGTGSEATKNAVISRPGKDGFKKSLRHDNFLPQVALLDPQLPLYCPPDITIYSAMDCFTQLLEGYTSTQSNIHSDMVAWQGLQLFFQGFPTIIENPSDLEARGMVMLAAYFSGLTLAHAGLGTVHGMAGIIGGYTGWRHGLVCSRLIPHVFQYVAEKASGEARAKLQRVGNECLHQLPATTRGNIDGLLQGLEFLSSLLPEENCALSPELIASISREAGDKNSPVPSSAEQRVRWLQQAFSQIS